MKCSSALKHAAALGGSDRLRRGGATQEGQPAHRASHRGVYRRIFSLTPRPSKERRPLPQNAGRPQLLQCVHGEHVGRAEGGHRLQGRKWWPTTEIYQQSWNRKRSKSASLALMGETRAYRSMIVVKLCEYPEEKRTGAGAQKACHTTLLLGSLF